MCCSMRVVARMVRMVRMVHGRCCDGARVHVCACGWGVEGTAASRSLLFKAPAAEQRNTRNTHCAMGNMSLF